MPGKNIVEIGFDYQQTQKEAQPVIESLQQILDLGNQIKSSKIVFNQFGTGIGAFKKETEGLMKAQSDLIKQSTQYTKLLTEQAKQQQQVAKAAQQESKALQEVEKTEQQGLKTKQQSLKYQQQLQKEIEKKEKSQKKSQKALDDEMNAYIQLRKTYNEISAASKRRGAELLQEADGNEKLYLALLGQDEVYQKLTADAERYNKKLDVLETSVGQYQRRAGDYQRSTFALTQVLREAPAFANSLGTGISAISNNIPILTDEFKKLKESTGSSLQAFKILAGGLFSFQALLPVAFLLLQTYSKEIGEFFKTLFSGVPAIDKVAESQRVLNEAFDEGSNSFAEAAKNIGELQTNVKLAADGFLNKKDVVEQYNETMGKVTGTVKTFAEVEAKLSDPQVLKDYANAMLYRAAANLAFEEAAQKAVQAEKDRRKAEQEFSTIGSRSSVTSQTQSSAPGFVPGLVDPGKQAAQRAQAAKAVKEAAIKQSEDAQNALEEVGQEFQKKSAAIFKKYKTDFFGKDDKDSNKKVQDFIFQRNKLILEDTIKTLEAIASNESILFTIRNKAAADANAKRIELINYVSDYEVKQEGVTANQVKLIRTQQDIDLRDSAIKYSDDLQSILVSRLKMQKAISDEEKKSMDEMVANFEADAKKRKEIEEATRPDNEGLLKEETEIVQNGLEARLSVIATDKAKEETILNAKYAAGKISEEKYQKELLAIQVKYSKESLQAQITAAQAQLKLLEAQGLAGTAAADKLKQGIAEAQAALAKLGGAGSKGLSELIKTFSIVNDAVQKLGGLLTSAADIGLTKEKNALQELEDTRQKNYENELARISSSTLSEENKANRIKILEAQREAQKAQAERKEREIEQRKARFAKAANIANIISAGALAVVKALPNLGLAIAAGALSAAQLAIAIATPIPTYAEGLKGNKGDHMGIYGEAGAELVEKPGHKPFIADNATLDFLPKGTTITPINSDHMNEMMHNAMIRKTAEVLGYKNQIARHEQAKTDHLFEKQTSQLLKGMSKNKSHTSVHMTIKDNSKWNAYIEKNIRGR